MLRIMAGRFRGRRLQTLPGLAVRPASERVKACIFDVLQDLVLADPGLLGSRRVVELPLSADADSYFKGRISAEVPEENRSLGDDQIAWLQALDARGAVETISLHPSTLQSNTRRGLVSALLLQSSHKPSFFRPR